MLGDHRNNNNNHLEKYNSVKVLMEEIGELLAAIEIVTKQVVAKQVEAMEVLDAEVMNDVTENEKMEVGLKFNIKYLISLFHKNDPLIK